MGDSGGQKDSWFVTIMGHDSWGAPPGCAEYEQALEDARSAGGAASLSGINSVQQAAQDWGSGRLGSTANAQPRAPTQPRFEAFGGSGHRLGEEGN